MLRYRCSWSFDLPRQQWSLNRFRTEQGHCGACRRKWRLTDTDLCPGALKMTDMKLQDMKMTDQVAGHETAGHENDGPNSRA